MSYMCVLNFIPRCFIVFDAIANGIIFLILFFGCSLLDHRNPIELGILDLIAYKCAGLIYYFLLFVCVCGGHMCFFKAKLFSQVYTNVHSL